MVKYKRKKEKKQQLPARKQEYTLYSLLKSEKHK